MKVNRLYDDADCAITGCGVIEGLGFKSGVSRYVYLYIYTSNQVNSGTITYNQVNPGTITYVQVYTGNITYIQVYTDPNKSRHPTQVKSRHDQVNP